MNDSAEIEDIEVQIEIKEQQNRRKIHKNNNSGGSGAPPDLLVADDEISQEMRKQTFHIHPVKKQDETPVLFIIEDVPTARLENLNDQPSETPTQ